MPAAWSRPDRGSGAVGEGDAQPQASVPCSPTSVGVEQFADERRLFLVEVNSPGDTSRVCVMMTGRDSPAADHFS